MDATDLRVEAILQDGLWEAHAGGPEPDDVCECGHVADDHGFWRGCFSCGCRYFAKEDE